MTRFAEHLVVQNIDNEVFVLVNDQLGTEITMTAEEARRLQRALMVLLPPRRPYVGEGVDGYLRSAQIDREEADCLPPGPQRLACVTSALEWEAQAACATARAGAPC